MLASSLTLVGCCIRVVWPFAVTIANMERELPKHTLCVIMVLLAFRMPAAIQRLMGMSRKHSTRPAMNA